MRLGLLNQLLPQILDGKIEEHVKKSGIKEGVLHLFAVGSTVALTTIEYEDGLREDLFHVLYLEE